MNDFVAIDVETANPDYESICQIGIVPFCGDIQGEPWVTLVNPEAYFDPCNIGIHGITQEHVRGAPTFRDLYATLSARLEGAYVACHSSFDRVAIARACERYNLAPPECQWIDTARVSRLAWRDLAPHGYSLRAVTWSLGVEFRHHDAGEDARACGEVLVRAMAESGRDVEGWLEHLGWEAKRRGRDNRARLVLDGDPDGPLSGEVIVFTGELCMTRSQAAEIAARLGCNVASGVTKKTTMLVVGVQNLARLAGYEKSAKHRRAEELIQEGHEIRIMHEDSFLGLVAASEST